MEEWQRHEKHELETTALLKELGFLNSRGQVQRFDGPKWYPRYKALGHTTLNFYECACKTAQVKSGV